MLKKGKLYGSIIPADVHTLRIKDVTLGEKVELQLLALTDHPVGRQDAAKDSPNEGDSGIEASTVHDGTINSEWQSCVCYTSIIIIIIFIIYFV